MDVTEGNKLVLIKKKNTVKGFTNARLDIETHATLYSLSAKTGISITRLIGICVAFATEHSIIVESEEVTA